MSKIGIIGTGHVGAHCAYTLALTETVDEIVLLDVKPEKTLCEQEDINDALAAFGQNSKVRAGGYHEIEDAEILVLSVGAPKGIGRLAERDVSLAMFDELLPRVLASGFHGIIISITNPCDIMAHYALKSLNWDPQKLFGTGTSLDSARLVSELSHYTGVAPNDITAYVLGEHGDSQMIPWSAVRFGSLELEQLEHHSFTQERNFDPETKKELEDRVRTRSKIIFPPKGATEYGIAAVLTTIVSAIFRNEKKIFPVSVSLTGQYGQRDLCLSTPCVLGRDGIEAVLELPLTPEELTQYQESAHLIRKHSLFH